MPRRPNTWQDIYYRHIRQGDDPAYALYAADEWGKRQEKRKMTPAQQERITRLEEALDHLPSKREQDMLIDHILGIEPWPGSLWIGPIFWEACD